MLCKADNSSVEIPINSEDVNITTSDISVAYGVWEINKAATIDWPNWYYTIKPPILKTWNQPAQMQLEDAETWDKTILRWYSSWQRMTRVDSWNTWYVTITWYPSKKVNILLWSWWS